MLVLTGANAQYKYRDSNRIGISGGVNQFSLNTKNFETSPGTSWQAGLSLRGNFYNDFDMVYGMRFGENKLMIETGASVGAKQVEFAIPNAQIMLLLSYKIVENHLSIELGPALQVNGQMKSATQHETELVFPAGVTAKNLQDVSRFAFYPTASLTTGIKHLRLVVMYQYGVTNMLSGLDKDNPGTSFKGTAGILSGSVVVYL
jgi:hypothetical protein